MYPHSTELSSYVRPVMLLTPRHSPEARDAIVANLTLPPYFIFIFQNENVLLTAPLINVTT